MYFIKRISGALRKKKKINIDHDGITQQKRELTEGVTSIN
jgi:hypothetical protein